MAKKTKTTGFLASNKNAFAKYILIDRIEAGIVLTGAEVKSIKNGKMNLKESFAKIINGEVFLLNAFIGKYSKDSQLEYNPKQDRKLLLNNKEIDSLESKLSKGTSLVPTKAYLKGRRIKIEIAVAKSKKTYDKRQELKVKEEKREAERAMKWKR
jgi:SsrA-binding protein